MSRRALRDLYQPTLQSFFTKFSSNIRSTFDGEMANDNLINSNLSRSNCRKRKLKVDVCEDFENYHTKSVLSISSEDCTPYVEGGYSVKHKTAQILLHLSSPIKRLIEGLDLDWCHCLSTILETEVLYKLADFVNGERKSGKVEIYPPSEQVFSWSRLTKPKDVRVVILGQDPYHGPRQAQGLAFSVQPPTAVPPSLANIYKEVGSDLVEGRPSSGLVWPPKHGDLTGWAGQGVLLLNSVLTVRRGQPNSHKDRGWEKLTNAVIQHLNDNTSNLVFLLWGANAQSQGSSLDPHRHLILKAAHPSPFSANRGFFSCKHFSKANDYLSQHNKGTIDWMALRSS